MEEQKTTDELSLKLEKSVHELFRRIHMKTRSGKGHTQGRILKILYVKGSMSQKDMQEKLHVQAGSISEMINKLEKKGLVIRKRDTDDRRKMILSLTEKGRSDVEEHSRQYQGQAAAFFQVLNEADKQELERILQILLSQDEEWRQ